MFINECICSTNFTQREFLYVSEFTVNIFPFFLMMFLQLGKSCGYREHIYFWAENVYKFCNQVKIYSAIDFLGSNNIVTTHVM